jgi:two-component sensor histidine kinase/DNA-binding response OmpR family regulator
MSHETILIVDDNLQMTDFLAGELLPVLGYDKILVAHDGKSAMEVVRTHQPDLILLDFQLSDTTGLEVLRRLASEGHNVPTILITAEGSEQIAVDAFRLGVQDYLIKPVTADSLSSAIARALTETRLRRETERLTAKLKQQVTWLTALSRVGQAVTSTLELNEVLRRIVEASVYLTQAEEGFLALQENGSDQLYLRAVKNIDQEECKTLRSQVSDSLVREVVSIRRPLRMSRISNGQPLKVTTGLLVYSLLYVPILLKDRVLGVLAVDNRISRRIFTEMDETLLTSLADYAAVAIENAGLYERAQQEIVERMRAEVKIEASLKEKEVLLKEIHHRVKNNLQVVSSLLNLQTGYVDDVQTLGVLRDSRNRIRSMALIHETLYKSQDLARVDFSGYIRNLSAYLLRSHGELAKAITMNIETDEVFLGIDRAVPCGLILNELISNSLKHAFPSAEDRPSNGARPGSKNASDGTKGEIHIELRADSNRQLSLVVSDNGVGFSSDLDFRNTSSLGLQLVNTLVEQLDGSIELNDSSGTAFQITFAAS